MFKNVGREGGGLAVAGWGAVLEKSVWGDSAGGGGSGGSCWSCGGTGEGGADDGNAGGDDNGQINVQSRLRPRVIRV